MEQRAIFNTSPKLRETPAPPAGHATSGGAAVEGSAQAAQSLNHMSLTAPGMEPTTIHQIDQQRGHIVGTPAIVEAKKVELASDEKTVATKAVEDYKQ